jgi:5-methylcytosine-specific restriction endonuclease McrA
MNVVDTKKAIRDRDGHRCVDCGVPEDARCHDVHRNVPGSAYSLEPGACDTLCERCHKRRHKDLKRPQKPADLQFSERIEVRCTPSERALYRSIMRKIGIRGFSSLMRFATNDFCDKSA